MVKSSKPRSLSAPKVYTPIGRTFLKILKGAFDASRLSRGREIFEQGRVLDLQLETGTAIAKIQGRPRPYRERGGAPRYVTRVRFASLPESELRPLLDEIGSSIGLAAQLVSHDLCWHDEGSVPSHFESDCDCPDERNPCKHVAALCYALARLLDRNPLALFELRGMSRYAIEEQLETTPLGRPILLALSQPLPRAEPRAYFYERPESLEVPDTLRPSEYLGAGSGHWPPASSGLGLPGILPRKGGDFPGFWEGDEPFTRVMDAFYAEIRRRLASVI